MEKTKLQKWIIHTNEELCEIISEKEGMLTDSDYDWFSCHVDDLKEILDWCTTIREAERIKKMLKG